MADFGFQTSQASGTSGIGGSGTTNYVSKFTAASTIGDSQIFDNATNVGIGTISPTSKLHILGIDSTASNFALNVENSTSASLLSIRDDGNTSIGNVVVNGTKLYLNGGATVSNTYAFRIDGDSANILNILNEGSVGFGNIASPRMFIRSDGNIAINYGLGAVNGTKFYVDGGLTASNTYAMRVDGNTFGIINVLNTGLTGFGKTTPTARVHVQGIDATSSNFALKVDNSASASLLSVRNDGFITINGNTLGAAKLEINGGSYQGIYSNSNVIGLNGTGLANGSIGIACSVQSGFAGTSLYIRSYDVSNKLIDIINSSTNPISRMLDSGYFGIGTISPTAMVHSKGIDATSSNYALKVENSTPTNLLSVRNDGVVDIYGTITPRLQSIVSSATVTPTNLNDEVVITAQATGLTLVNPTGTAVQGQSMIIRIKDNGTARTIAYDTQYRAIGVTLPTTTVINKIVYLGLIYNSTDTKWDVIGVSQEA